MISVLPMKKPDFHVGDKVVLAEGPYEGTPGVFLALREDVSWADINELNNVVRYHPVRWLQPIGTTVPGRTPGYWPCLTPKEHTK